VRSLIPLLTHSPLPEPPDSPQPLGVVSVSDTARYVHAHALFYSFPRISSPYVRARVPFVLCTK